VPSTNDVVRASTDLAEEDLAWLHALMADWQLLADLSFADLVLWVPDRYDRGFWAAAQIRPTTGPTALVEDVIGHFLPADRRPLVDVAFARGVIRREGEPDWGEEVPVRGEAIPVRRGDTVIGVIARNTNLAAVRTPSRLELAYLGCASELSRLISEGRFPQSGTDMGRRGAPRVGDGLIRLDADGIVTYASPNALSVYRRLGLSADLSGHDLGAVTAFLAPPSGPRDESLQVAVNGRVNRRIEIEGNDTVAALRTIPVDPGGVHSGAMVLCRDVTEIRRRERELVTKDATIREIHHRVKNNLQTVAALLRLQERRLDHPEGQAALREAERRVGTIAVVHETLARTAEDVVEFDDVLERLLGTVVELSVAEAPDESAVQVHRTGRFGELPATVATALAMALTEVLQNAAEHGLRTGAGTLKVEVDRGHGRLTVTVADDGPGLPVDFDPSATGRLGLQIVRTLVTGELGGSVQMQTLNTGGTQVMIDIPLSGSGAAN